MRFSSHSSARYNHDSAKVAVASAAMPAPELEQQGHLRRGIGVVLIVLGGLVAYLVN